MIDFTCRSIFLYIKSFTFTSSSMFMSKQILVNEYIAIWSQFFFAMVRAHFHTSRPGDKFLIDQEFGNLPREKQCGVSDEFLLSK